MCGFDGSSLVGTIVEGLDAVSLFAGGAESATAGHKPDMSAKTQNPLRMNLIRMVPPVRA